MKSSLVLLITLSCYSAFFLEKGSLPVMKANNGFPYSNVELSYVPIPPFLKSVGDQARQDLFAIIHNNTLTKAEIKEEINKWAKVQGRDIEDAYAKFWKHLTDIKSNAKKEINYQLENLEKAFSKLEEIMANEAITMQEEKKQMDALFQSLDRDVLRTLNVILSSCGKKFIRNRGSQRINMLASSIGNMAITVAESTEAMKAISGDKRTFYNTYLQN
uniref:DUF148 domain-containing protein n=1 Tax=Heterorhabditis bacteriophora TaxID=37862 RepID=A0A1I7WMA1_HETBA